MPFKTIFCVTGVNEGDDALEEVIELCQNTNAHLSVLVVGVTPTPPLYTYGVLPDNNWAKELTSVEIHAVERGEVVERQIQHAGISADVSIGYCEYAQLDDVIGERARYADVTLIKTNMSNEGYLRDKAIYGALFHSLKPVLLSPASRIQSFDAKKIMIAWDSGLLATRAVGHAVVQMKNADEVHIVMVDPVATEVANGREPGADLAQYLARHGIKIEVERLTSGGQPIAKILQQHAIDMNADLIVMGAFGHSRLRQLVFGGTTSAMLENLTVPTLMAH